MGAGILNDRPLNSTAMTTAVHPSELVFEFASNGMDEINQVNRTPLLSLKKQLLSAPCHHFGAFSQQSRQALCEQQGHCGMTGCNLRQWTEGRMEQRGGLGREPQAARSTKTERLRNVLGG